MNSDATVIHAFESLRGGSRYRLVRRPDGSHQLETRRYANKPWVRMDMISADVAAREMANLALKSERRGVKP